MNEQRPSNDRLAVLRARFDERNNPARALSSEWKTAHTEELMRIAESLQRQVDALSIHASKWVTRALQLQQRAADEPPAALTVEEMPEPSLDVLKRVAARMRVNAPDTAYLAEWAVERIEELDATFDLRWKADMRAIKRWQEAHPGNDLTWPDHADMVVWLLEQLDARPSQPPEGSRFKVGDMVEWVQNPGHPMVVRAHDYTCEYTPGGAVHSFGEHQLRAAVTKGAPRDCFLHETKTPADASEGLVTPPPGMFPVETCADCGRGGELINFNGRRIHEVCPAPEKPATHMPPCPICKRADCRLTYEECDRARLGGPSDPMTQLDSMTRAAGETSAAHEHSFQRMPDTPVGYACECGESPPIGWYPESEEVSR